MNDFLNFRAIRIVQFFKTYLFMYFRSTNSNEKGITRYDGAALEGAPRVKKKKIDVPKCSDFCRV